MSVQKPPRGREHSSARLLLPPTALMAAAAAAAVALVPPAARPAVAGCGALAVLLVLGTAGEAARPGRLLHQARAGHARHSAYLEQQIALHHHLMHRFVHDVLPLGFLPGPGPDRNPGRRPTPSARSELMDRPIGAGIEAFWKGLPEGMPPDATGPELTDFTRNPTKYLHLLKDPAEYAAEGAVEADDQGDLK
ncbi:hypothetical protein ACH4NF_12960 [Streptomyces sp. NPDC017248]|uniref:hypothetical protein n=1 Tax=unclassified Streptomyces TaxID=2593676 RepID=UPI0037A7B0D1